MFVHIALEKQDFIIYYPKPVNMIRIHRRAMGGSRRLWNVPIYDPVVFTDEIKCIHHNTQKTPTFEMVFQTVHSRSVAGYHYYLSSWIRNYFLFVLSENAAFLVLTCRHTSNDHHFARKVTFQKDRNMWQVTTRRAYGWLVADWSYLLFDRRHICQDFLES